MELLGILTKMMWINLDLIICCFVSLLSLMGLLLISILLLKLILQFAPRSETGKLHVAFFHPYCNAGGGGERVLWSFIKGIHSKYPEIVCSIYSGDNVAPEIIMENVSQKFNINLEKKPRFIFLNSRPLLEAQYYPILTLLFQSIGSLVVGAEALSKFRPDIFIDTTGYAFNYPWFRFIGGCTVISYTHYPTISTDMLGLVSERIETYNNRRIISRSCVLSFFKIYYYYLFAILYGLAGSCTHIAMVNSSWTKEHITSLWMFQKQIHTVFPPCDTSRFSSLALLKDEEKKLIKIVSIGQIRPEKNYRFQLQVFKKLLESTKTEIASQLRLVLIGGLRNSEDENRLKELKELALELEISDKIVWHVNAPFSQLMLEVQSGTIGIHAMHNEHFGIGIVESMAGGLIMVAHNSGGPKLDIITPYKGTDTGFLATTEDHYVLRIKDIISLSNEDKMKIKTAARSSTNRFSEENFIDNILQIISPVIDVKNRLI